VPLLSAGQAADRCRRRNIVKKAEEGRALVWLLKNRFDGSQRIAEPIGIKVTACVENADRLPEVAQFVAEAADWYAHGLTSEGSARSFPAD
jgi:hypothetical protein